MSHFGVLSPPYLGHLNPMQALGDDLVSRGHAVSFLGLADLGDVLSNRQFGLIPLGRASHPAGTLATLTSHMAAPRGLGLFRVIADMARMTDMLCREAPAAVARHGIDALLVDQLEPAGGLVADHLRLPFVSVANALPINREPQVPPPFTPWRPEAGPGGVRRNLGGYRVADAMMVATGRVIAGWSAAWALPPRRQLDACLSRLAQVTQVVSGFDFPRGDLPPFVHHCGPFRTREEEDLGDLAGDRSRPLVFASLGTLQGGRFALFRRIAEACVTLDLRLVIAHGGALTREKAAALPGRPIVRSFVPQRALLAQAALAVTNGGLNTVMDALAARVPLVTVPIAFEQGAIGARLEHCGAGIAVPLRRATAATLADAMARVLSEPSFRKAAGRIAGEIGAAGGTRKAADVIEAAVLLRRPVGPEDLTGAAWRDEVAMA